MTEPTPAPAAAAPAAAGPSAGRRRPGAPSRRRAGPTSDGPRGGSTGPAPGAWPDVSNEPAGPHCPWCSAPLASADLTTCPSCGAQLNAPADADVPGRDHDRRRGPGLEGRCTAPPQPAPVVDLGRGRRRQRRHRRAPRPARSSRRPWRSAARCSGSSSRPKGSACPTTPSRPAPKRRPPVAEAAAEAERAVRRRAPGTRATLAGRERPGPDPAAVPARLPAPGPSFLREQPVQLGDRPRPGRDEPADDARRRLVAGHPVGRR